MKRKIRVEIGSGNVFADIGLPNPEERLAKARLAMQINDIIEGRRLTQLQAAKLLGIDQPKVSALRNGRLAIFSLERLMQFLVRLGRDINIVVETRARSRGQGRLRVA